MSIDAACAELVQRIEGAVACAVIDVASEEAIGSFPAPRPEALGEPAAALRLLAAGRIGGEPATELQLTVGEGQRFARLVDGDRALVVLLVERRTNVGLTWALLRAATPSLESGISRWRQR